MQMCIFFWKSNHRWVIQDFDLHFFILKKNIEIMLHYCEYELKQYMKTKKYWILALSLLFLPF